MAEQIWDSFARLNAGERFKRQSAEMGAAATEAIVEAAQLVSASAGKTSTIPPRTVNWPGISTMS